MKNYKCKREVGIDNIRKSKETRQEYHARDDIINLQIYPYFWLEFAKIRDKLVNFLCLLCDILGLFLKFLYM